MRKFAAYGSGESITVRFVIGSVFLSSKITLSIHIILLFPSSTLAVKQQKGRAVTMAVVDRGFCPLLLLSTMLNSWPLLQMLKRWMSQ